MSDLRLVSKNQEKLNTTLATKDLLIQQEVQLNHLKSTYYHDFDQVQIFVKDVFRTVSEIQGKLNSL